MKLDDTEMRTISTWRTRAVYPPKDPDQMAGAGAGKSLEKDSPPISAMGQASPRWTGPLRGTLAGLTRRKYLVPHSVRRARARKRYLRVAPVFMIQGKEEDPLTQAVPRMMKPVMRKKKEMMVRTVMSAAPVKNKSLTVVKVAAMVMLVVVAAVLVR